VVAIAPGARRWPMTLAATAKGGNRTDSYRIDRTTAARDGRRWAGAAYDGAIVWDGDKRVRVIAPGLSSWIPHDAALADDGATLLAGLHRVDLASGAVSPLAEAGQSIERSGNNEVTAVAWPSDGAVVLVSAHFRPSACCRDRADAQPHADDRVLLLDGKTGALVRDLAPSPGFSHGLAASRAQLVAGTRDGLTSWDRASLTATTRTEPRATNLLLFDPSGRWLASTDGGVITLWRMPDFCPVARVGSEKPFVHALAFHPTAPVLFAATDHTVHVLSIDRPGEELGAAEVTGGSPAVEQGIDSLAVTGDGTRLVVPVYLGDDVLFFDVAPP
jgi:hypothetical protein